MSKPSPGTPEAVKSGCTCPVMDNHHGAGYMGIKGVYVYSGNCPIHKQTKAKPCESNPATN